jgi:hypothetical protein
VRSQLTSMLLGAVAALTATSALAEDPQPAAAPTPAPAASMDSLAALVGGKTLSAEELGEQRAKAKIEVDKLTINTPDQDGLVAGNAAVGNTTGQNSIAADAFVNADGFINAVQNTGNNVLIQSSTIINVSVEP